MTLLKEVEVARQKIFRDGYDMSFGEVIGLYERNEIIISPEFQRLFRWSITQKTRFIESILLNIPIPPIFVFAKPDSTWELVDGLQRLSTIFQFVGVLRGPNGEVISPFSCEGTQTLPALSGVRWGDPEEAEKDLEILPSALQISLKRSRIRVEILGQDTDERTKYELFQRLNTGGANLSEQEIRNCVIVSINKPFFDWFVRLSEMDNFRNSISMSERQEETQFHRELVVRFLVLRNIEYRSGLDLHEYLDEGVMELSKRDPGDLGGEQLAFERTFSILREVGGKDVFKRFDGTSFGGNFSLAAFETVTLGVSRAIERNEGSVTEEFVRAKLQEMWRSEAFAKYTGAGVRGTTRLQNLVFPLAEGLFRV